MALDRTPESVDSLTSGYTESVSLFLVSHVLDFLAATWQHGARSKDLQRSGR